MGGIPCWLEVWISHRVIGYTWPPWERGTLLGMEKWNEKMRRNMTERKMEMEKEWNGMVEGHGTCH